jgi:2'-5' RNA ligase
MSSTPTPTPERRFFVALLPPTDLQDEANAIIQDLSDRFQTSTAKAPPHITLYPPFLWRDRDRLIHCLTTIAAVQPPIPIQLNGFGAFPPRVLYVNVVKTPELMAAQAQITATLATELQLIDATGQRRGFHPHLTVASRHLNRTLFQTLWAELKPRPFTAQFTSDRLTLLEHNGRYWRATDSIPLGGIVAPPEPHSPTIPPTAPQ